MKKEMIKSICEKGWESKRLIYRKLKKEDAEDMFEYASDEKTCYFLKWGPYTAMDQVKSFLEEKIAAYQNAEDILWGIEAKEKEKLIGVIRIYHITQITADISYIQNPLYCGNGFMTEAVDQMIKLCINKLELPVVQAYFAEENIRSRKVMERVGMKLDDSYLSYEWIKNKKEKIFRCKMEQEK